MATYPGDRVRLDIDLYAAQLEAEANHLVDMMDLEVMKRMRRGIPEREAVNTVMTELEKGEGFARAWTNRQNKLIASMDNETVARPVQHHAENNPNMKFAWVLGAVKTSHCSDCLRLSKMEPRTVKAWRQLGYGLPREGETECSVGCKCALAEVEQSKAKAPVAGQKPADPVQVASQVQKGILEETKNRYEILAAIDKDGQVLFRESGTVNQVSLTADMKKKLYDTAILTHNHPSSSSFSPDDVYTTVKYRVKEMRAVAPDSLHGSGYYYIRPKVPADISDEDGIIEFIFKLHTEVSKLNREKILKYQSLIDAGEMSVTLAKLRHFDEIWEVIAKRRGWEYGFQKE